MITPVHNLIKYSDIYSKTTGSLWQYCRDKPALDNNNDIIHFYANNNSISFKFKEKIIGETRKNGTKYVHIMVP